MERAHNVRHHFFLCVLQELQDSLRRAHAEKKAAYMELAGKRVTEADAHREISELQVGFVTLLDGEQGHPLSCCLGIPKAWLAQLLIKVTLTWCCTFFWGWKPTGATDRAPAGPDKCRPQAACICRERDEEPAQEL